MRSIIKRQELADKIESKSGHISCKLIAKMEETLGSLISKRLKELDLSKAALAKKVGVSRAYITDLANESAKNQKGKYAPTIEVIQKLSKHLNLTEERLLKALGYNVKIYPDKINELINEFEDVPEEVLNELYDYLLYKKLKLKERTAKPIGFYESNIAVPIEEKTLVKNGK